MVKIKFSATWIQNFLQNWNISNTLGDINNRVVVLYGCQFEKKKSSSWKVWKNPWSYILECFVKYCINFVTFFAPKKVLSLCNYLKNCAHNTEFRKIISWCCTDKKMVLYGHQRIFLQLNQLSVHFLCKIDFIYQSN